MGKKAVLIGCNYPGTKAQLRGCVNDAKRMYSCLVKRYGFIEDDIVLLIDNNRSYVQPTGVNIMNAFFNLVNSAKAGDVLYIHYSGHGTRLPAGSGDDDKTGYDECIVPTDMNLITDEDFRNLVNKVPEGCRLTIVSDSCHSGGLIDETIEQIGNSTKPCCFEFKRFFSCLCPSSNGKSGGTSNNKSLPLSTIVNILKQKTGDKDINVAKLRPTLFNIFGDHASPKVKKFMKNINDKVLNHEADLAVETREDSGKQEHPDNGILISGCQTNQFSTDFSPSGDAKDACGALSNAIQMIIAETNGKVTNAELVLRVRRLLRRQGFSQRPGLYCSDNNVDANFLC